MRWDEEIQKLMQLQIIPQAPARLLQYLGGCALAVASCQGHSLPLPRLRNSNKAAAAASALASPRAVVPRLLTRSLSFLIYFIVAGASLYGFYLKPCLIEAILNDEESQDAERFPALPPICFPKEGRF